MKDLGKGTRIDLIDLVRGFAIFLMVIFHFSWDLSFFRLADINVTLDPFWIWFARFIAGMILLVVGASFALTATRRIKTAPTIKRLAKVSGCALIISVGTYQALGPQSFIFFGILHHIVFASLVLLVVRSFPSLVLIALAVLIVIGNIWFRAPFFGEPWLVWLGLWYPSGYPVDFVPVFPWLALPLVGMVIGRWLVKQRSLANWEGEGRVFALLRLAGKHSLLIYMLHQPIMFGAMYALVEVADLL